jgi:3-oxoacyl-[acyl-carrier protein] reductase
MAIGMARAGTNVVITAARSRGELESVVNEAAKIPLADIIRALTADVTSAEDAASVAGEAVHEFGSIDILLNNAGRGMRFVSERFLETPTKFWKTDTTAWRMIVDTNVNGPFLMARAVVPQMIKQHWGRIHQSMSR